MLASCAFDIGGNPLELADGCYHLGHIITFSSNDKVDIQYRRNKLVGQTNNLLCFFHWQIGS